MLRFKTNRLIIRSFCQGDLESLYDLFSCEEVTKYEDFFPMSRNEVQKLLTQWIAQEDHFAVLIENTEELIGEIGYWRDENENYSITFDFFPAYADQGYATEALTKLMHYLFRELNIKDLFADCDENNVAACKLLGRLGFSFIDQLKDQSYKVGTIGNINLYRKRNDFSC